jgi:hypothetical protein
MLKILAIPILLLFHPVPVSMTSIEHIPGTDSLKVLVRLNYDLFLQDYQQTINDDLDLQILRNTRPFPADLINNYINSKVFICVNKKILFGKLLNAKITDGDISLNMLYRLDIKLKRLTVRNTILTGLYSDVENLTIIRIMNFERGIKFTQEHNEESFVLK